MIKKIRLFFKYWYIRQTWKKWIFEVSLPEEVKLSLGDKIQTQDGSRLEYVGDKNKFRYYSMKTAAKA